MNMLSPTQESLKKLSVLTFLGIVAQTAFLIVPLVWYVASLDAKVMRNAETVKSLDAEVDALKSTLNKQEVAIGRIEVGVSNIKDSVRNIERSLDRGNAR